MMERSIMFMAGIRHCFLLYQDGQTVQITPDQMAQHDDKMRREYRRVLRQHQPKNEEEFSCSGF